MVADTWCGIIRVAAALTRLTEIPNVERVTKEPIAAALAVRALGTGFPFICKKKLCEKNCKYRKCSALKKFNLS